MILLDTTVLAYAVGGDHPLRAQSRQLLQAIGEAQVRASTTVEVIQEFVHVRGRRYGRDDAVDRARSYIALLAPLVRPDADDLSRALELFASHERLGAFDAVVAATARSRTGMSGLVSADRGFAEIDGLTFFDLGAPDLLKRLGIA